MGKEEREREREESRCYHPPVWFVPHATFTIVSPARAAIALGRGWASYASFTELSLVLYYKNR